MPIRHVGILLTSLVRQGPYLSCTYAHFTVEETEAHRGDKRNLPKITQLSVKATVCRCHVLISIPGRQPAGESRGPSPSEAKTKKRLQHDLHTDHPECPQPQWAPPLTRCSFSSSPMGCRWRLGFVCWRMTWVSGSTSLSFTDEETEVLRGEATGSLGIDF